MIEITYPFDFIEMLLTHSALNALGFTEYCGGCGAFGDRRLDLGAKKEDVRLTNKKEYPFYLINEMDEETQDEASGQGYGEPYYCVKHYTNKDFKTMYFLHEMYEDILTRRTPEEIVIFIELTKKKNVNMWPFLRSYIEYKDSKIR